MKMILAGLIFGVLCGCTQWQATQINTGVAAGRTFEDGSVFASGKTAWTGTINVVWTRSR